MLDDWNAQLDLNREAAAPASLGGLAGGSAGAAAAGAATAAAADLFSLEHRAEFLAR
jgi:hypothetical protein